MLSSSSLGDVACGRGEALSVAPVEALLSHSVSGETGKQENWGKEESEEWLKSRRCP